MITYIYDFDVCNLSNRNQLRQFIQQSWAETYLEQVGDKVTSAMIATLADESLGGILPSNEEKVIVAMDGESIVVRY